MPGPKHPSLLAIGPKPRSKVMQRVLHVERDLDDAFFPQPTAAQAAPSVGETYEQFLAAHREQLQTLDGHRGKIYLVPVGLDHPHKTGSAQLDLEGLAAFLRAFFRRRSPSPSPRCPRWAPPGCASCRGRTRSSTPRASSTSCSGARRPTPSWCSG